MRAPGRLLRARGRRSRHSVGARRVRGARDEFRRARDTSRLLRSRLHAIGSAVAQTHDTLRGRLRARLERARARRLAGRAPERRPRLRVRARAHAGFRRGGRVRLPVRYVGVRLREGARRKTRGRRARQANARFRAGAGLLRLARRRLQRRARARRVRGGDARRRERTPVRARRSAPKIAGGGGGARARDATLRRTLPEGVGVYTTAVCRADREFLEVLFETQSVPVLCDCAYAAGVSSGGEKKTFLPAHVAAPLCVIKGTRRYDGGGAYAEMDAGDLARAFAVCGRAGVDRDARVVIMTHRDTYDLYARRAKGSGETVASSYSVTEKIRSALAERLNGLFVCGALTDAADAEAWFDETLAGFGSRRREARDAIDAVTRELRELGALDTSARRRSDANVPPRLRRGSRGATPAGSHRARRGDGRRARDARDDARVPGRRPGSGDDARASALSLRPRRVRRRRASAEREEAPSRVEPGAELRGGHEVRALPRDAGGEGEKRERERRRGDGDPRAAREVVRARAGVDVRRARTELADAPERARREAERFAIRAPALAGAAFATFAAAGYRPIADGRFSACFAAARLAASLARAAVGRHPDASVAVRAARRRGPLLADTGIDMSLDDARHDRRASSSARRASRPRSGKRSSTKSARCLRR